MSCSDGVAVAGDVMDLWASRQFMMLDRWIDGIPRSMQNDDDDDGYQLASASCICRPELPFTTDSYSTHANTQLIAE